jgi:hypothetical protein
LAAELALGADLARDARHLVGERRELVDHRVDGRADPAELALDRAALDRQLHLLAEVAVGDGVDDARDLGGGADEVVDQGVDRARRVDPVAAVDRRVGALGEPALAADDAADARDLLAEALAAVGELVERAPQVGGDAAPARGKPQREVAVAGGLERVQELLELLVRRLLVGGRAARAPAVAAARRRRAAPRRLLPLDLLSCRHS